MELNQNFLYELFLLFFRKKDVLETAIIHLQYHFLPNEQFKKVFKYIKEYYVTNKKLPSIGIISQAFLHDKQSKDINTILSGINEAQLIDEEDAYNMLEIYIKDSMSIEFYDEFQEKYTEGKKDEARQYMREMSEKIGNFSIRNNNYYTTVFGDFKERNRQRVVEANKSELLRFKVPFSIDELDDITGGIRLTENACLLARSGAGKTKALRWIGLGAVRRGFRVLHIQAEGSKDACLEGYDATWTAVLTDDIRDGSIDPEKYKELDKIVTGITSKGVDIFVHAFEQFNSGSMSDVRNILSDCVKYNDNIDLIVIDYLERLEPGDGLKYSKSSMEGEKMRRSAIADKMKNLSLEFGTRIVTATQANDIPPSQYNDPEWILTRHNVSLAKNLPDSFAYFLTLNQTNDEKKKNLARIFCDKLRFEDSGQIIKIYQNYAHDRFYDKTRTLNDLYL